MQKYIFIILLSFIACNTKKENESIDDRYIVFNLYIGKNLASHSITLDFKDKSVFVHNIINEANFDRFVEDEVEVVEVVEGTLPKEAIKQKNDRIDYNTIYELGFIADNKMTTDTNVLFEKIDSILQNGAPFSCKRSQPAPDEYVYMSFNYFEGNKRVYYCFNPTGKEWDIFYWWCYKKYDTDLDISIIDV
ncbi:hypothetical protein, partial [Capnocytophaga sputigena]|uniref:hypothetical protein n=1 Tax=Capnocytophaga sputigena TaxID=1019 RepID=UPI0028D4F92F